MLVYVVGHGLVKGALFMVAGILLATRASIDEIGLRGLGREGIWPAGIVMGLGGLVLGGLPFGITDEGFKLIDAGLSESGRGWVIYALALGAAMTGGAVLRATGRIFIGLGPDPGSEESAPTEDEQERADRPFWLMIAPGRAAGRARLRARRGRPSLGRDGDRRFRASRRRRADRPRPRRSRRPTSPCSTRRRTSG